MAHKILFVFGTRPEAIKLCPVLLNLRQSMRFQVRVCVTAQHRSMLDQVLAAFNVTPDCDLDLMQPGQTLAQITARILVALEPVIQAEQPDMVVVQGDTTTITGYGGGAGRYHNHARRCPGGFLPTRAGGTCGSRTAHRRPGAAISRGDESRGRHP